MIISNSVDFKPNKEILFEGPFDNNVISLITIKNNSDNAIVFKIKTTTSFMFFVKPAQGIIYPGNSLEVKVICKPMKYDPRVHYKSRLQILYVFCENMDKNEHLDKDIILELIKEKLDHNPNQKHVEKHTLKAIFQLPINNAEPQQIKEKLHESSESENSLVMNAEKLRHNIRWYINDNIMLKRSILELRKRQDAETLQKSQLTNDLNDFVLLKLGGEQDPLIKIPIQKFYGALIILFFSCVAGFCTGRILWPNNK